MSRSAALPLLVLATRNAGKARELSTLLTGVAGRVDSLLDHAEVLLPEESGPSYREIALAKARAVFAALAAPALGDDSGLEVDALNGAPGLRSARYAGADATDRANNERLLDALRGVSSERRKARFRCVLALVRGEGDALVVEGVCEGRIAESPRGAGGFGYDPLFVPEGESRTFAEFSDAAKNRLSHRARAARALREALGDAGDS